MPQFTVFDLPPISSSQSTAIPPLPTDQLSAAIDQLRAAKAAYIQSMHQVSHLRGQIFCVHHVKLDLQFRYWNSRNNQGYQAELQKIIREGRVILAGARKQLREAKKTRVLRWLLLKKAKAKVVALLAKERVLEMPEMYLTALKARRGG